MKPAEERNEVADAAPAPVWRGNLFQYPNSELRVVVFADRADCREALKRIFDPTNPLYGVPLDGIGARTIAVPAEALKHICDISFETYPLVSISELPADQRATLRR